MMNFNENNLPLNKPIENGNPIRLKGTNFGGLKFHQAQDRGFADMRQSSFHGGEKQFYGTGVRATLHHHFHIR